MLYYDDLVADTTHQPSPVANISCVGHELTCLREICVEYSNQTDQYKFQQDHFEGRYMCGRNIWNRKVIDFFNNIKVAKQSE